MKNNRVRFSLLLIASGLIATILWFALSDSSAAVAFKKSISQRTSLIGFFFGDGTNAQPKTSTEKVISAGQGGGFSSIPTKRTNTTPIAKSRSSSVGYPVGQRPAFLGGEEVTANISVNGNTVIRGSNQIGNFGRVLMAANSQATIGLSYPPHAAREPVIVEAEDGGVLQPQGDQKKAAVSQSDNLDDEAKATVNFVAGTQAGIYRVTMRHGADLKEIDFWVGPEIPVAGVASK